MRVTSEFFVSALVRRLFAENGFASISRKGNEEAGAIYISVDRLDASHDLYGPAPQAFFMENLPQGRLFEQLLHKVAGQEVAERLKRETTMDPDIWVVEVEARDGVIDLPVLQDDSPTQAQDELREKANRLFR